MIKILYSAGNRSGANSQLIRFLEQAENKFEVKIAAYIKSSRSFKYVDWTLDCLHNNLISLRYTYKLWNLFGHKGIPRVNFENVAIFLKEVKEFNPDLIICDGEEIAAHIGKTIGCRVWYCSPLHLWDGTSDRVREFRYQAIYVMLQHYLNRIPTADRTFIYSPFCNIKHQLTLKDEFEFIKPYYIKSNNYSEKSTYVINERKRKNIHEIIRALPYDFNIFNLSNIKQKEKYINALNNSGDVYITNGETSYISDAIYNRKKIIVLPNINDWEMTLNANIITRYNLGYDLGQLEYMKDYAREELIETINKEYDTDYLNVQGYPYLHEVIEKEFE